MIADDLQWLSRLSNLRYLDMSCVNLSLAVGWLSSISKIPSLSELHLSTCGLHQVTPKSIIHLNSSISLKLLGHGENSFNSSILQWIVNVCKVLTHLDLSFNSLQQNIPNDIGNMVFLQYLDLSFNELQGSIPKSFSSMCQLKKLDLSYNKLSGQLSHNIQQLCCAHNGLQELDLGDNPFESQPIPDISCFSSLDTLSLRNTNIVGILPKSFFHMPFLGTLDFSHNHLNGVDIIDETHLSNLSKLTVLDVTQNSLLFNLSSNWIPHFRLDTLHASSCTLGPKFPGWLKHNGELRNLEISNIGILDSFPKWFWNLSSSLTYLNVSYNKLNGPLPMSFPRGKLSDCWRKFEHLVVLDFGKNNLSGKVPNSFGALREIKSLYLNNNNFSGELPSLNLCHNLELFDVADNNLQGTLPMWIGHHLQQLIILRLRANKFQGNIPTSMCNLSFLQVLDLSTNNITGQIPQCFSHIIALSNLMFPRKRFDHSSYTFSIEGEMYEIGSFKDKAILAWKGSNREYGKNLGLMTIIDLSNNHLTGEIPKSITKLVALAGLNLSRNNLTGLIPNNIGHMETLESLDLSRNHLSGRMPPSFSYLTFLSYMNLSFNNLEGKIPLSTQLQSFDPSTYVGNSGLCGQPLINLCPSDVISPTKSHDKHATSEDEDKLITIGFYVSLVIGFFVGFWGVCGTLVIKTSWRHAYFKFFNNLNDWIHVTLSVFVNWLKNRLQVED
ncbi:LRR receptor-like kinase [Medicago truncatula]|uniref:LRR receptor-like kinase n=1 Tax=Medicago truncatula TaxID=3880 RepID=A0A072THX8_MEDTR|nr:LRR receptor-like kinase [Medicago truncatula]